MRAFICPNDRGPEGSLSSGRSSYKIVVDMLGIPKPNPVTEVLAEEAKVCHTTVEETVHHAGYLAVVVPKEDLERLVLDVDQAASRMGEVLDIDVAADPDRQMGLYEVSADELLANEQFIHGGGTLD